MLGIFTLDNTDPVGRALRRYLANLKRLGMVLTMLTVAILVAGVPHFQTSYRHYGRKPDGGGVATEQKIGAWYLSVTGFQYAKAGQYGPPGCPMILFIPIWDCLG